MAERLVHSETPMEYFKDVVTRVMARQGFESDEHSSYYLVQLLDKYVIVDRPQMEANVSEDETLAEMLCRALRYDGRRRFELMKLTGDVALFASGFFSDYLVRRQIDLEYYTRVGGYAYSRAAVLSPQSMSSVFEELSANFNRFVDVLNEVSEESTMSDPASVLALYERWLATGSKRSEARLRDEGILLSPTDKRVH